MAGLRWKHKLVVNSNTNWLVLDSILSCREFFAQKLRQSPSTEEHDKWNKRVDFANALINEFMRVIDGEIEEYKQQQEA